MVETEVACFHCGQECGSDLVITDEKRFCCQGCKMVYEILNENNLCEYYSYTNAPGVSQRFVADEAYAFLDEATIRKKLLSFDSDSYSTVQFFVPAIHCISCIWLLENLQRLNIGVLKSEVNFSRKQVTISYNPALLSLSKVAALLASLGYAPTIRLETQDKAATDQSLVLKLAIAGFCFGNIMLLSFPEYLGLDGSDPVLKALFSFLNFALAIPAVIYSGQDYFRNAWKSFQQRQINIDVPIAVGLAALFLRSSYDIFSNTGPGYLDSLSGLVFFLLIGRWFQSKTYESLAFDRDYKSYFPLAIQKWTGSDWAPVIVYELQPSDRIRVRHQEIIPADSRLLNGETFVDYSFVTGESKPVKVAKGDLVYAGGRLLGQPVELVVEKKTSQSHLTSLWNNEIFQKAEESGYKKIIDRAARSFTWAVMALAVVTALYWYFFNPAQMWLVITSVLMVACPCALALAAPFTYGNMLRVFGKHGFYLKNADVIERLAQVDAVVFDKTGTITHGASHVKFVGVLEEDELVWVKQLTSSSSHPLSKLISQSIRSHSTYPESDFYELTGKGVGGNVNGHRLKIGSSSFVGLTDEKTTTSTRVFVSVDQEVRGYFNVETSIRSNIKELVAALGQKCVALLSGDQKSEEQRMREVFPLPIELRFNQDPHDKMNYVSDLQKQGRRVVMLGDGLNDSGALKQSQVGIAVTDDTGIFTPACDGILQGSQLSHFNSFLRLSKSATQILKVAFGISFFYNIIALSFAVSGNLSPLIAAILMPISSVSVVGFSTLVVNLASRGLNRLKDQ
ncbi:MAG: heavy metal translocating P-type ATPase metal-binding domain-containing protein [Cytophagales bacterium]|jgi:Cu+-exporting ATPase|nr:heavy metal translocating P-type ATPase metal-binding domain-containing protein [Cytophagales bacterium]MCA6386846.1 heavy metal translocating P-type ATPase metal-binding domain-containing protein [Cytophagales bacterium]MCA6390853.1 heavy metal translocating P-type ATPase metal-binding domain-containing protein [Cytophagales bacterium]MCA6397531.1 heavy metal translocating P-type ATPase metal-binding domain-containing protein [Cytophagales bacterium]MCA6401112.1 heavy metal translocating P-